MSKKRKLDAADDMSWELESTLEPGMLRFMANVIESGLNIGLRTDEDFIRHFSPMDIMQGLAERPDLRTNILVPTTGLRAKIATKKSAEAAGTDLQIALDEGETDASLIVSLFHPDDRVRYLDKARLWNYVTEPKFWTCKRDQKADHDRAKTHIAFILDRAIEERMLTQRELVEGITVANLVKHLPQSEMQAILELALENSHDGKAFSEQDLLEAVPSKQLVEYLPLPLIWDSVVRPWVADRSGLNSSDAPAQGTPSKVVSLNGTDLGDVANDTDGEDEYAASNEVSTRRAA